MSQDLKAGLGEVGEEPAWKNLGLGVWSLGCTEVRSPVLKANLPHLRMERDLCLPFSYAVRLTSSRKPPKIAPSSELSTFVASKSMCGRFSL